MGSSVEINKNGNPLNGSLEGSLEGVKETAAIVVAQAKMLAPSDKGRLRNSISYKLANNQTFEFNNDKGEKADNQQQISLTPPKQSAYAGTNVGYGIYQEFGTKHQAPQPYLRPAGAIARGQSVTEVIKKIQQEEMLGALKVGQERINF